MDGENKKSIAVLVRARNHLRGIVREFHKQGIRFQAKEIDPLVTRPVIQDLLALMRALLSPADRVAWLSILRAPWCGLTLEDLHKLCAADGRWIIREVLNSPQHIATLSADAQSRLERFVPALENALKALPSANFRNVLEGCWIHLGGPACADAQTLQDVEVFFDDTAAFNFTASVVSTSVCMTQKKRLAKQPLDLRPTRTVHIGLTTQLDCLVKMVSWESLVSLQ